MLKKLPWRLDCILEAQIITKRCRGFRPKFLQQILRFNELTFLVTNLKNIPNSGIKCTKCALLTEARNCAGCYLA